MGKIGKRGAYKYTREFLEALADKLLLWIADPKNFWLGDFAAENKMWTQRMDEFCDENNDRYNEKFHDAYRLAKQVQQNRIVKFGMAGKINPTMAIFSLKNVAGWRDEMHTKNMNVTVPVEDKDFRDAFFNVSFNGKGHARNGKKNGKPH